MLDTQLDVQTFVEDSKEVMLNYISQELFNGIPLKAEDISVKPDNRFEATASAGIHIKISTPERLLSFMNPDLGAYEVSFYYKADQTKWIETQEFITSGDALIPGAGRAYQTTDQRLITYLEVLGAEIMSEGLPEFEP